MLRDGETLYRFPGGIRIITDRAGKLLGLTGMVARTVSGVVSTPEGELPISLGPNEVWAPSNGSLARTSAPGLVAISYG